MSGTPDWMEELLALCDAVIDDQLTDAQQTRLEELVLGNPAARRAYVEYLHQHACLSWSFGDLGAESASPAAIQTGSPLPGDPQPDRLPHESEQGRAGEQGRGAGQGRAGEQALRQGETRWLAVLLSSAAALLVGLWSGWAMTSSATTPTLATLARSKACTFSGGTLPTETGARLTPGTMSVASGMVQVRFDSGALLTVEGPTELEIVSARRCVLRSGRVMAEVSASGDLSLQSRRVTVRGQNAIFGLNVVTPEVTEVQAVVASVTASLASGRSVRLEEGNVLRIDGPKVTQFLADGDELPDWEPPPLAAGTKIAHITTGSGRGRDAYVESTDSPRARRRELLLAKSVLPLEEKCQRKVYLGFDLAAVAGQGILDARLDLTMCPIPTAFTSMFPDATFAVYGLTDETLDDWDEAGLNWNNAPANRPGGTALDPAKVTLLGRFQVEEGVRQGTFSIDGPALAEFLRRDHNGLATLIVVRETTDTYQKSLIHGFASRWHSRLPPPTLKLTLGPAR